ncbi:ROK family protein [Pseudoduganella buxea]|uniref:ROK family protein n=1 Tax=Pseudoduganella buxea TaxID=1949069 RepID=A0A6I3T3L9_9BURK|nr:ROK family protein [Pseudoduganella buxea]MTV56111.1 ROK family protein [Pseudoduganella buxea]GGC00526.1 transcriptional regulator [Pseudoduganella buxea]
MTSSDLPTRGWHGIDIGGTKIELVSYDGAFAEVFRERIATPAIDFAAFVDAIVALVSRGDAALGGSAPVGIGLPGVIDQATGRQVSSNVPALNGREVATTLRQALGRPVAIGNDCQCFALSEARGGAAAGLPSMFGAIVGTGAGGGYCADGRLQRGFNGIAGEWGHWTIPASLQARYGLPLFACPCGKAGCLERYVSGPGMSVLHGHFGGAGAEPLAIVARGATGDEAATRALAAHVDLLGHALAGVVLACDPHAIVLGGGLSNLAHLYQQLPAAVQRHLFRGVRVPPILPPRFGAAGGARGAALLARQSTSLHIEAP